MKLNDNNVTVGLELVKEILLVASEKKFSCSSSLLLWLPFSNDLVLGMTLRAPDVAAVLIVLLVHYYRFILVLSRFVLLSIYHWIISILDDLLYVLLLSG